MENATVYSAGNGGKRSAGGRRVAGWREGAPGGDGSRVLTVRVDVEGKNSLLGGLKSGLLLKIKFDSKG